MAETGVRYLVFDIESIADGDLVSRLRYPGRDLSAEAAVALYRSELMEKHDSDFIPYTFQIPLSIAIAKVAADFRLIDLVALDEPQYRPHMITERFGAAGRRTAGRRSSASTDARSICRCWN